jgi:hypothetical protein
MKTIKFKMRKEKRVVILLVAILLVLQIYFVLGQTPTLGVFKLNDCIGLKQTCSNCSSINITSILFPDSTQQSINGQMTKTGSDFNYSFCNNSQLGNYIVNGIGDPDGVSTVFAYNYIVTTTGNDNNNTIPLFLALGGFIIFIIAIASRNLYIGFISGIIFIVLGIYLMIFGLGSISDFYTQTLSYVALGFGLLIFLSAAYEAINDNSIHLWKKGGDDNDDDF